MPSPAPSSLLAPTALQDLLLYRLNYLLRVASSMVTRLCEGGYGITRREWGVLALLAQAPSEGLQPSQMAQLLQLDRARTSKTITALVGKQLVLRQSRPGDARQKLLQLSAQGRTIYTALYPQVRGLNLELLSCLDASDVQTLDAILTRLQQQADTLSAHVELPKANRRLGRAVGQLHLGQHKKDAP